MLDHRILFIADGQAYLLDLTEGTYFNFFLLPRIIYTKKQQRTIGGKSWSGRVPKCLIARRLWLDMIETLFSLEATCRNRKAIIYTV